MQPDIQPKVTIRRIAQKEITLFFASPIAYLFLGTFATVTLFVFFWGESYFARNIADVRPLFEWMPVLLIFLSATLTMRLWSEERRSGTLEYVLTQATPLWHFVLGKFLGCIALLLIALAITLPLPITVAIIGDLDWGPVWAGYLATLLMGAAYLSIGLFVSARSQNQIISLISACALCGVFYLFGTSMITEFFGAQTGEWLRLLGMGSRFDAITRGVIDLRDLYYYLSIVLVFLALNTLVLERERWATVRHRPLHRHWVALTLLVAANALGANLWLGQLDALRVDVTAGQQYSISPATRAYLAQLQEPLLIRGYFSSKTHPLLAPLVPQMRDLLKEYKVAGGDKVRVEFVDPLTDPQVEQEANQKYGIQPVPFQMADRYQSSIVSSYFNVLVEYGSEHQVLDFRDLIEVQARGEGDIEVQLRNPEHDLTAAIKKVLNGYQAGGNLFDTVKKDLVLEAYISDDALLPEQLVTFKQAVHKVADDMAQQSQGRLAVQFVDPDADHGKIGKQIAENYGFNPMTTNLLSDQRFYFYVTLRGGDQVVQIPLGDLEGSEFKRNLDAAVKRFASGFTKTVALVTPVNDPAYAQYGLGPQGPAFSHLEAMLGSQFSVVHEDLGDGSVGGEADILLLVAPDNLDQKQLFAVDQFLMKGGTVIAATSPRSANLSGGSLGVQKHVSGLEDWLQHYGLAIGDQLVMDPQNAAFPVPVTRNVGGFQLQEVRMLDYPYFIDVRGGGLNHNNLITSELPQVTLSWASPISVDKDKQGERKVTELLNSSDQAWLSDNTDVMPRVAGQGEIAFAPEGQQGRQLLGLVSQGRFDSYFAGKPSPLVGDAPEQAPPADAGSDAQAATPGVQVGSVIEHSPDSARIILFSSNDFLSDQVVGLLGSAQQTEYLNTLQMTTNAIDWSLEDAGLLSIRSRGHFNRTLPPMERTTQMFWEYLNYALAALALVAVAAIARRQRHRKQQHYLELVGV